MRLQRQPGCSNPRAVFKDDEQVEQIRKRLDEGMTYRKLAEELHCSPATLWNLHKNGRYPRK